MEINNSKKNMKLILVFIVIVKIAINTILASSKIILQNQYQDDNYLNGADDVSTFNKDGNTYAAIISSTNNYLSILDITNNSIELEYNLQNLNIAPSSIETYEEDGTIYAILTDKTDNSISIFEIDLDQIEDPQNDENTFISTWDTTKISDTSSNSNQIKLPLKSNGEYDFMVDWGDGTTDLITEYNQDEVTHTYSQEGVYEIKIDGIIKGFSFNNAEDRLKLLDILQYGTLNLGNGGGYFMELKI